MAQFEDCQDIRLSKWGRQQQQCRLIGIRAVHELLDLCLRDLRRHLPLQEQRRMTEHLAAEAVQQSHPIKHNRRSRLTGKSVA